MSSIRRRAGRFTLRETLPAKEVLELSFDVWEHIRDVAGERLGMTAPPLSSMSQSICYLRVDAETGERSDVVNGEQWTHAEFTLRGTIPVPVEATV